MVDKHSEQYSKNYEFLSLRRDPKPKIVKIIMEFPSKWQSVPIKQLEQQCHFEWIEGFAAPKKFLEKYSDKITKSLPAGLAGAIDQALSNPYLNDLALYKVNDQIGYVVIYLGNNPIPANTYLSFYAGKLCDYEKFGGGAYAAQISYKHLAHEDQNYTRQTSCVDAEFFGNITRFIPDLPLPEELDNFEFSPGFSKDSVMTANLHPLIESTKNVPFKLFKTSRLINKGDMVGYQYCQDAKFWFDKGISRKLFSTNSQVLTYGYRLRTIDIRMNGESTNKYTLSTVEDIYASLREKRVLQVFHSEINKYAELSAADIEEALVKNGYSPKPSLPINEIVEGEEISDTKQNILASYVHANFKCFMRKDNSYIIDAIVNATNSAEAEQLTLKLGAVGFFPRVENHQVAIDAVNTKLVGEAIRRLQK